MMRRAAWLVVAGGWACGGGGAAVVAPVATLPGAADGGPTEVVLPAPASSAAPGTLAATSPSAGPAPAGPSCAERCSGTGTSELVAFAMQRATQTRPCYDSALSVDRRLRGKMEILVRVTGTGAVCETRVLSSSMPVSVSQCVTRVLGGADYPAPRGGCLDVAIPLSFEPRDADAGTSGP